MKVLVSVLAAVFLITSTGNAQTLGTSAAAPSPVSSFSSTTGLFSPASGVVGVSSAGTEKMRINATGVGIGTISPGNILHVYTTSLNAGITIQATSALGGPLLQLNNTGAGNHTWDIISDGSTDNGGSGAFEIYDVTAGATRLVIGTNGDIGIGTSSPQNLLDVNGAASIGYHVAGPSNGLTVKGNVGIGTTIPTAGAALDLSYNTNSMLLPVGTTGQEPSPPVNGMVRYNSTTNTVEAYANGVWSSLTPSGSDVLIASASASNSANIQFTNIPSGYDQYELRYTAVVPVSSGAKLIALLSENNGSSYITSNYTYGAGDGYSNNSGAFFGASGASQIEVSGTIAVSTSLSGTSGKLVLTSLGSSSVYKMFSTQFVVSSSGLVTSGFLGGIYTGDTNAVNALEVSFNTGNISTGNFALYGIRNH